MADRFTFKDAAGTPKTHASTDLGSDVHIFGINIAVDAAWRTDFLRRINRQIVGGQRQQRSATALPSSALASRRALIIYQQQQRHDLSWRVR